MARVLALSSHIAYGAVGLAAVTTALRSLGHEVVALPTVILSNHPGHPFFSGVEIAPETLDQIIDSIAANGWLADIDAVLTGYLPTPGHVAAARSAVLRVRAVNAAALFVCDPVFGDDPNGLYIDEVAAGAIRRELVPLCDIATPNRFELSWLANAPVETVTAAAAAARRIGAPSVLVTSVPAEHGSLATLLVEEKAARACYVARREGVPHGTGDLLAALYAGYLLSGTEADVCLGRAVAGVAASIAASADRDELPLAGGGAAWGQAQALPTAAI